MTALRKIEEKSIPYDRIMALLQAAHEIPNLYKLEHVGSETALGADDFLPIFIYVVVRAQIKDISLINEEMQALCDPDGRMSEAGYYLATLEASIQHISDIDINTGELQEGMYVDSSDESDVDNDGDDIEHTQGGRKYYSGRHSPVFEKDDDREDEDGNAPDDSTVEDDDDNMGIGGSGGSSSSKSSSEVDLMLVTYTKNWDTGGDDHGEESHKI